MIEQFNIWDQQLFLWLNGFHADWLDPMMLFITAKNTWIPLYLLIVVIFIRKLGWRSIYLLAACGLLILLADQSASGLFKPFFERLRPCHNPQIQDVVHTIKHCGGQYGFASSHASNTFALATFLFLLYRNKWSKLMLGWAVVVSYSRIYAGVHYPADILVGAILGALSAIIVYFLYRKYFSNDLQKIHSFI
ncbi:MAG: undecaprenyl-diphosphatase [Marivirga sp.]|jgi:undecaprenyl-diphosphatase